MISFFISSTFYFLAPLFELTGKEVKLFIFVFSDFDD